MKRFWIRWWSGNYGDEGCSKPPFQIWQIGSRDRESKPHSCPREANPEIEAECDICDRDQCSFCALIDAASEDVIWPVIKKYFPDYEKIRCEQVRSTDKPNDRFPDFQNKTSLYGKRKV